MFACPFAYCMHPRFLIRRFAWIVLILLSQTSIAQGNPQNAEAANAHTAKGIELRQASRDAEALAAFEAAYRLVPSPKAMAQRAFAEQALGRWVEAETHFRDALGAQTDDWVRQRRTMIEDGLREVSEHIGSIQIEGNIRSGLVEVNGKVVANLPMKGPVSVTAGTAHIVVRAPGFRPVEITRQIAPQALARESVTLSPSQEGLSQQPNSPANAAHRGTRDGQEAGY